MKTKTATLIMLDKPILVNEETLKEGEICIDGYNQIIPFADLSDLGLDYDKNTIKKILAGHEGTKRLILSDEVAKQVGYVDVEKLAINKYPSPHNSEFKLPYAKALIILCRGAFIKGANKIQSLTPKKYTEEELKEAFENSESNTILINCCGQLDTAQPHINKAFENFKERLRQPKKYKVSYTETENGINVPKLQ